MSRCDFTELPTEGCAHCLGHVDQEQQDRTDRARLLASGRGWFPAQFPGCCQQCGERFAPGAAIRIEIPAGWRGECCADGAR